MYFGDIEKSDCLESLWGVNKMRTLAELLVLKEKWVAKAFAQVRNWYRSEAYNGKTWNSAPSRSETMICIMSGEEGPPGNNDESTMSSVRWLSSFCWWRHWRARECMSVLGSFGTSACCVLAGWSLEKEPGKACLGKLDVVMAEVYCTITTNRSEGMTYDTNCSLG